MVSPRARCVLSTLFVWLGAGCPDGSSTSSGGDEGRGALAPIDRPSIELVGCRHHDVDRGTCHLSVGKDRTLHIWLDLRTTASVRLEVDGLNREPDERVEIGGGVRLHLTVGADATRLRIAGAEPPWREPFELAIVRDAVPAAVAEAERIYDEHPRRAIEVLQRALEELDGVSRLMALRLLWKLMSRVHDVQLLQRLEETAQLARRLGRTIEFGEAASTAVLMYLRRERISAARRWVQQLDPTHRIPQVRIWANYYGGIFDAWTGDLGGAVRAFSSAREDARRVGMNREFINATEHLAGRLADLGRGVEALTMIRDTLAAAPNHDIPCRSLARLRDNAGWTQFRLLAAGLDHDPPAPLMRAALIAVQSDGECPDPRQAAYSRVNLAELALYDAEPQEAMDWIEALRAEPHPPELDPWATDIATRAGLATGRWELVEPVVYAPIDAPRLRLRSVLTRAQTLERMGMRAAAIDAYRAAEAQVSKELSSVTIAAGREPYLVGRQQSARRLVELLVEEGQAAEALCRARLARGRALQTVCHANRIEALSPEDKARRQRLLVDVLEVRQAVSREQRDDWRYSADERDRRRERRARRVAGSMVLLDQAVRVGNTTPTGCDDLTAAARGELLLMDFPRSEGMWLFTADVHGVEAQAVETPTPRTAAQWSHTVLGPLAGRIEAARQLRVIPTGAGWRVPYHALPLGEGVVLDATAVVYALDIPQPAVSSGSAALVVANAAGRLPHAEAEARQVVAGLEAQGWDVELYEGAEATRAQLVDALPGAALFHYAGHGTRGRAGGWDAALLLHQGETLGVA
ncbi:MAG: CHAT domain-containing protein, partial [Deltaproteobacteria bacterium]|nr:CHAT domain-containing protein [Deltaproteobacteria bacterium]